jgi:hypothetical protein
MMDPDEYFTLFHQNAIRPNPLSGFRTEVRTILTERLSGGCLLYRLAVPNRRDADGPETSPAQPGVMVAKGNDE